MAFACSAIACDEKFQTRHLLSTHNVNYHQSLVKSVKVKGLSPQNIRRVGTFLPCPCGAEFANKLALESHCSRCNLPSGPFVCRQGCAATFPAESARVNHEKGLHGLTVTMHFKGMPAITISRNNRREFICPQCSEAFVNNQTARSHAFVCPGPAASSSLPSLSGSVSPGVSSFEEMGGIVPPQTPPADDDAFNLDSAASLDAASMSNNAHDNNHNQLQAPSAGTSVNLKAKSLEAAISRANNAQSHGRKRRKISNNVNDSSNNNQISDQNIDPNLDPRLSTPAPRKARHTSRGASTPAAVSTPGGNMLPPLLSSTYRNSTNVRNTRSSQAAVMAAMAESAAMATAGSSSTPKLNEDKPLQLATPNSDMPMWKNIHTPVSSRSNSHSSRGMSPTNQAWPFLMYPMASDMGSVMSPFETGDMSVFAAKYDASRKSKDGQDDENDSSTSDLSAFESASVLLSLRNGSVGHGSPEMPKSLSEYAPNLTPDTSFPSATSAFTMPLSMEASNSRSTRSSMGSLMSLRDREIAVAEYGSKKSPPRSDQRQTRNSALGLSPSKRKAATRS